MLLASLGIVAIGVTATRGMWRSRLSVFAGRPASQPAALMTTAANRPSAVPSITSYRDLLVMKPEQLAKVDIALMNLLCARGLPGSEDLDIPATLHKLDGWAKQVEAATTRHSFQYQRDPGSFDNSLANFRICELITSLQLDLGMHYNKARQTDGAIANYGNSKDCFIHGLVDSHNGGTCVSIPVVCVAVGRRLGYPLKLVLAKQHVFCRWEDSRERFNFDPSGSGFCTLPDEHFRTFPKPMTDREAASGEYLKSLTPFEELALFLRTRADCLVDRGKFDDARGLYVEAVRLMPQSMTYRENLKYLEQRLPGRPDGLIISPTGQMLTTVDGRPMPPRQRPFEVTVGPKGKLIMTSTDGRSVPTVSPTPTAMEMLDRFRRLSSGKEERKP